MSLSCTDGTDFDHGFFDKGSFIETLNNWAKTVVTGRARLGGIPCGIIAVETRSVECIHPADPANPDTETTVSGLGLLINTIPPFVATYDCLCGHAPLLWLSVVMHTMAATPLFTFSHMTTPLFTLFPTTPPGDRPGGASVVS